METITRIQPLARRAARRGAALGGNYRDESVEAKALSLISNFIRKIHNGRKKIIYRPDSYRFRG
jgi:hypothetical protein